MLKEKSIGKKIWDFLWKSNSVWSWIVDLILIFLIVKFIIFPIFSLALGAPLPFVIIESGSLEHRIVSYDKNIQPHICGLSFERAEDISRNFTRYWQYCGNWYEEHNITREQFEEWPYSRGLNKGDIIVVKGLRDYSYETGDIIIFSRKEPRYKTPIIHRVIDIESDDETNEFVFSTKGDHNSEQWGYELEIEKEQIIGRAVWRIPKLGWVKLFFVEVFR